MRYIALSLALIASLLFFTCPTQAEPQDLDQAIEILARGPVHEAYAAPVSDVPVATPVIPRQPPALLEELPAEQKPEGNVQWISGYWAWDDDRNNFLWVSGFWRLPPPGREWIPGHWTEVAGGWQWTPGFWAPSEIQELAYYPTPPEPVDTGPSVPAPTETSIYVPGNWVYQGTGYVWRAGCWLDPRPGWVWIPAHYVWTPAGYLYVNGYWDYPLRERGLLFAPVAVDLNIGLRPHWHYRPRYVVNDECLLGALFVNTTCNDYYFGDYFDVGYLGRGLISWLDFRFGRAGCDPLFSYYRSCYGPDSDWEHGLRDLYEGRFSGALARPPRTLIQQNVLVQNITNNTTINNINNTTNVTNIQNVTMLTPLAQVSPAVAQLQPVTEPVQQAALRSAQERLTFDRQRGKQEAKLALENGSSTALGLARIPTTQQVRKISLGESLRGSVTAKTPAPLTTGFPSRKVQTPSAALAAKPQVKGVSPQKKTVAQTSVARPSTTTAAKPPAQVSPVGRPSGPTSSGKTQALLGKQVGQHAVTSPSLPKPAAKARAPLTNPAPQHSIQPKPAVKSPAVPAPKPIAKTAAAPARSASLPAVIRPAAKPAVAAPPKVAIKSTPAARSSPPASHRPAVSRPAGKPATPAVARPATTPAPKPAAKPAAPVKSSTQPASKSPAPKENSKDRHR